MKGCSQLNTFIGTLKCWNISQFPNISSLPAVQEGSERAVAVGCVVLGEAGRHHEVGQRAVSITGCALGILGGTVVKRDGLTNLRKLRPNSF